MYEVKEMSVTFPFRVNQNTLSLHILNVGHGDSIILELPERSGQRDYILIDSNNGQKLIAYLNQLRVTSIAIMIATHPHLDHIRGLRTVLEYYSNNINQFWEGGFIHTSRTWSNLIHYLQGRPEINFHQVTSGMKFNIGEVIVEVLAPSIDIRNLYETFGTEINNASIVLRVSYGEFCIILSGDAQWTNWGKINEEYPHYVRTSSPYQLIHPLGGDFLHSDLFKVSHHGSVHGIFLEVLERLNPRWAVISNSDSARFPPDPLCIASLQRVPGTRVCSTSDGTKVFSCTPNRGIDAYNVDDGFNDIGTPTWSVYNPSRS